MWHLHHDFLGHPCTRSNRSALYRGPGGRVVQRLTRPKPCDRVRPTAFTDGVRDGVTAVLRRRGIDHAPVGGSTSWLWCLGGPDLYRRPLPDDHEDYFDPHTCIDLNVWVCAEHQVFSADLYPFDLVDEVVDSEPPHRRSSTPQPLAADSGEATSRFLIELEQWLDRILVEPES